MIYRLQSSLRVGWTILSRNTDEYQSYSTQLRRRSKVGRLHNDQMTCFLHFDDDWERITLEEMDVSEMD